ncbi:MAG TPA: TauD/TfdA family dioxygenase [Steroidobacteraceae bacterium]|nr:TauD/TfdA family dioxygenase [Steroidobacteraceae bacterium]
MSVSVRPLHPLFVGEVSGVDLREPLSAGQVAELHDQMNRCGLLVFHDQAMTPEQQLEMTRQFGTLELGFARVLGRHPDAAHKPPRTGHAEVADMSNLGADGRPVERSDRKIVGHMANQLWHSDSSFQKPAARYSLLLAVRLPSWGGETEFCDLRAAYDALEPRDQAALEGLEAEHYALHSRIMLGDEDYSDEARAVFPPVTWPIVRTHGGSGRKLLYIGVHARRVLGMPVAEGRVLLMDLLEHATQPRFVYRHTWRPGDLIMWDNRATLHRGRRWDLAEVRELRRTTTADVDAAA